MVALAGATPPGDTRPGPAGRPEGRIGPPTRTGVEIAVTRAFRFSPSRRTPIGHLRRLGPAGCLALNAVRVAADDTFCRRPRAGALPDGHGGEGIWVRRLRRVGISGNRVGC